MKAIRMLRSEDQESPRDTQQITCLGFPVSERECRPLIKPKLSKSCNYANEPYSSHSPHLLIGPPWGQNIIFSFAVWPFRIIIPETLGSPDWSFLMGMLSG